MPSTGSAAPPSGRGEDVTMPQQPSPAVPARPIGRILEDVAALGEEFGIAPVKAETAALRALLQGAGCRLAIVGSFNVGKSTLVNALLGQTVVPTSTLPNTSRAI